MSTNEASPSVPVGGRCSVWSDETIGGNLAGRVGLLSARVGLLSARVGLSSARVGLSSAMFLASIGDRDSACFRFTRGLGDRSILQKQGISQSTKQIIYKGC